MPPIMAPICIRVATTMTNQHHTIHDTFSRGPGMRSNASNVVSLVTL